MSLNLGPNTMLPLQQLGSAGLPINTVNQPSISLAIPSVVDFITKYNGKCSRNLSNKKFVRQLLSDYSKSGFREGVETEDSKEWLSASYQAAELFYSLEYTITDHILFWIIFGDRFIGSELNCLFANEIKNSLNRFDRLSYPIGQRVRWSNWYRVTSRELTKKSKGKTDIKKPVLGRILKFVRGHRDNEPITAYRGFLCRKELGHRIRKSDVKGDGDFWTQIEGAGTSYTLNPDTAVQFATRRTDYKSFHYALIQLASGKMLEPHHHKAPDADWYMKTRETEEGRDILWNEYANITGARIDDEKQALDIDNVKIQPIVDAIMTNTDNKMIRLAADLLMMQGRSCDVSGAEDDDTYAGFGVRPVIGQYQFFKEDIISVFDYEGETELTVFPNDVTLQRYEFLTPKTIVSKLIRDEMQ